MAYEMVMPYHLHMPSYFLETFTEYPFLSDLSWTGVWALRYPVNPAVNRIHVIVFFIFYSYWARIVFKSLARITPLCRHNCLPSLKIISVGTD